MVKLAYVNRQSITEDIKKRFAELIPSAIKQELREQEKLDEKYTELTKPVLEQLTQITSTTDSSDFATADIPTAEVEPATVLGSMTGTGSGYSWSNAPGRIAMATEQLKIPAVAGYKVATSTTPGGMLFVLGVGAFRAVREYA